MTEEDKYEKLYAIVKTYLPDDVNVEAIKPTSNFTDIILENEDMDGMQTVQDALAIINTKIAEK